MKRNVECRDLYRAGIDYYQTGKLMDGRKKTHDVYLCDTITDAQKAALLAIDPRTEFKRSSPQYAPEITRCAILVPVR